MQGTELPLGCVDMTRLPRAWARECPLRLMITHSHSLSPRIQWSPLMEIKMPVTVSLPVASQWNKCTVLTEGCKDQLGETW